MRLLDLKVLLQAEMIDFPTLSYTYLEKNVMELFNSVVERRKWRSMDSCLKTGRFSWAAYVTSIIYDTSMFLRENKLFYF